MYDRLALMDISVFHLSHCRLGKSTLQKHANYNLHSSSYINYAKNPLTKTKKVAILLLETRSSTFKIQTILRCKVLKADMSECVSLELMRW